MSSSDSGASRPLSPHLSIYRFHLSMALSILHRAAGMALFGALLLFILWLWSAAYDAELFDCLSGLLRTPVGIAVLVAASFVFYFKFATGMRHLWWDTGRGFALKSLDKSGYFTIAFTFIMTALTWGIVYCLYFQE